MFKIRDKLTVDANFKDTNLFICGNQIISKQGFVYSTESFFNEAEGCFFLSQSDLSMLLSTFLFSLYRKPCDDLIKCISDYFRIVNITRDRRYFNLQIYGTQPIDIVKIKNPPFEFLYGDYLCNNKKNPHFLSEIENICCSHFIYLNCGALSSLLTSSFGLGDCISDSAEKVFQDVLEKNPASVISILNSDFLKILHDDKVPILNHKVENPKNTVNYMLDFYGEGFLKDLWSRLLKRRLPAFIYEQHPDFLNLIFDLRVSCIRSDSFERFIEDDLGLRFSLYYSNTPDFRVGYNRMLIKFFHSSEDSWGLV